MSDNDNFADYLPQLLTLRERRGYSSRITNKINGISRTTTKIKLKSRITMGGLITYHDENKRQFTFHVENKSPITDNENKLPHPQITENL